MRRTVRGYEWLSRSDEEGERERQDFESWLTAQLEWTQARAKIAALQRRVTIVRVARGNGEDGEDLRDAGYWLKGLTLGEAFEIMAHWENPPRSGHLVPPDRLAEPRVIEGAPFFIGQTVPQGTLGWALNNRKDLPLLATIHARIDWADGCHWIRNVGAQRVAVGSSESDKAEWEYALPNRALDLKPETRVVLGLIDGTGQPVRGSLVLRYQYRP
jgi:hypothetical protein